jgi:threonyl-tRNA synthetase
MRVEVDDRYEKIGYKIRQAQLSKIPYMLVIGDKEMEENAVAVRSWKNGDLGSVNVDKFVSDLVLEIAEKRR